MRNNQPVTVREVKLTGDHLIVSKTDLKGRITYVNHDFIEISGFGERELLGQPHNLVRHPDMPVEAFEDLWNCLKAGLPWTGYVKNRCKNGDYYWVLANAAPIVENGAVVGYMSVRRQADPAVVAKLEAVYASFRERRQGRLRILRGQAVTPTPIALRHWSLSTKLWLSLSASVAGGFALGFGQGAWPWLAGGAAALLAGVVSAGLCVAGVKKRLQETTDTFSNILHGSYANVIDISRDDETGRVLQGLQVLQTRMGFEVAEMQRLNAEMARVRIALDNVSTGVMIADPERVIIYANKTVRHILGQAEADIRAINPDFSAEHLVGQSIDVFHKNPQHQAQMLANLRQTHVAKLQVGEHYMTVAASPVFGDKGERLGSVAEWKDRTAEVLVEREIEAVVAGAVIGDFNRRLNLDGKEGFIRGLAEGLNRLTETTANGLGAVGEILSAIARQNLAVRMEGEYQGAFGQLQHDANATIDTLREVVGKIQEATVAVNAAAREIALGNGELANRTEEQATGLEETASTMEELNTAVQQNSHSADEASKLAERANEVINRIELMVRQVVETMDGIQTSSRRIADIVSLIDGISFQTNILALNAAVEAARAGEQGRGFAVVAGEVRQLAQNSAQAAKEIKALIDHSVSQVNAGAELVNSTGGSMSEVVGAFEKVALLLREINGASAEQSRGLDQITNAINEMDDITQHNAALVEQAHASAASLESQAESLFEMASQFNLGTAR